MNKKLLEEIKEIHAYYTTTRVQGDTSQLIRTISKLSEAIIALNEELKNDRKNAEIN